MISINCINDTKKWVLIVDKHYGTFSTKEDAEKIFKKIDSIEESPFGSIFLLPPNYIYKDIYGNFSTKKISEFKEIDICNYVNKNLKKPFTAPFVSVVEKYKQRKEFSNFFDEIL